MSRIQATFSNLAAQQRKALIPYVMAGYPKPNSTVPLLHAMVAAGADMIELGMPFSDPMADGPVIQKAAEAALAQKVGMNEVLAMVAEFRQKDPATPIILMGYANPVERYNQKHAALGEHAFVKQAAAAGVDGVLIVDYPPDECVEFKAALDAVGVDLIFLLAPTSTEVRMKQVGSLASGYVYYVSLKGVTGSGALDTEAVAKAIPQIKQFVNTPVGVGFGIRDAASAVAVAKVSDAVVIGSKIIQLLEADPATGQAQVSSFLAEIRAALDAH